MKSFNKFLLFCILIICFLSCVNEKAPALYYEVISIQDGDTFTLLTEEKEQKKIRLYGIDCPEKGQPFGANAKQALSNFIFRKKVRIELQDTDRYGRTVAIVYNEQEQCINEIMLLAGLAWHYKAYDNNKNWSAMEAKAKSQKIGLWSHPNAIAPWAWRKGERQPRVVYP